MPIDHSPQTNLNNGFQVLDSIRVIHTLGPAGTNLAAAAAEWFSRNKIKGDIELYETVESAIDHMPRDHCHALLTCAVYPNLYNVVFNNLSRLKFIDSFIWSTFPMLLASRDGRPPRVVSTHPAPQSLVPQGMERVITTSNSQAAVDCASGKTDGCITTMAALEMHGLKIVENFGPVPMVFTLHGQVAAEGVS
ncbi:hypothetical protein ACFSE1_04300 [Rhizobium helianthi]|uniref:Prephenate dehydratase n=1 Tax=Rhizobium helianthi TaxID=1132695 RepID=A0ABW4M297_9HYPH